MRFILLLVFLLPTAWAQDYKVEAVSGAPSGLPAAYTSALQTQGYRVAGPNGAGGDLDDVALGHVGRPSGNAFYQRGKRNVKQAFVERKYPPRFSEETRGHAAEQAGVEVRGGSLGGRLVVANRLQGGGGCPLQLVLRRQPVKDQSGLVHRP